MNATIGSRLTVSAYASLAQLHRPSEPEALATEIRRLHKTGLTARDIATALRMSPDRVINILGARVGPQVRVEDPSESGAFEIDRELSLVERRIIELQNGLRLLQVERDALIQQLRLEAAYD
jgi:hypothetical protein